MPANNSYNRRLEKAPSSFQTNTSTTDMRVNIYTVSSLFLKKTFLGVCDYLKLSQVQRFKRYHQVFSSLSQKQISDTRQRRTKFHYIEISLSLWTYENNYSSAPKRLAQSCSWIWVLFRHVRVWTLLFKHHFKKNCAIRVLSLSMHLSLSTQKLIMANFTKEEPKYIIS